MAVIRDEDISLQTRNILYKMGTRLRPEEQIGFLWVSRKSRRGLKRLPRNMLIEVLSFF